MSQPVRGNNIIYYVFRFPKKCFDFSRFTLQLFKDVPAQWQVGLTLVATRRCRNVEAARMLKEYKAPGKDETCLHLLLSSRKLFKRKLKKKENIINKKEFKKCIVKNAHYKTDKIIHFSFTTGADGLGGVLSPNLYVNVPVGFRKKLIFLYHFFAQLLLPTHQYTVSRRKAPNYAIRCTKYTQFM